MLTVTHRETRKDFLTCYWLQDDDEGKTEIQVQRVWLFLEHIKDWNLQRRRPSLTASKESQFHDLIWALKGRLFTLSNPSISRIATYFVGKTSPQQLFVWSSLSVRALFFFACKLWGLWVSAALGCFKFFITPAVAEKADEKLHEKWHENCTKISLLCRPPHHHRFCGLI